MNIRIAKWLDEPAKNGKTVLSYLAELIAVNNGQFELTNFGQVTPNDSYWRRSGLSLQEALDLLNMTSFLKGMMCFLGKNEIWKIKELIQAEINRLEKGTSIYVPTSEETRAFGFGKKVFEIGKGSKGKMDRGR